jgi:hypothetical protein
MLCLKRGLSRILSSAGSRFLKTNSGASFQSIAAALKCFQSINGTINVPEEFEVPKTTPWPVESRGLKLHNEVKELKSSADGRKELKKLKLHDEARISRRNIILTALKCYKSAFGDLLVPQYFTVPQDVDYWPEETRGLRLGKIVGDIRKMEKYRDLHGELEKLGFVFTGSNEIAFQDTLEALSVYKRIYGNYNVKNLFVVPHEEPWPVHLRGIRLGYRCSALWRTSALQRMTKLQAIGFPRSTRRINQFHEIKEGLEHYLSLHKNLKVPERYVIPEHDDWPKHLWGMRLGLNCRSIRLRGSYSEFKHELSALGFSWERRLDWRPYEVIFKALKTYKKLYGDLNALYKISDYIVPVSDEWPPETWGINLSQRMRNIYSGRSFKSYREELKSLGIILKDDESSESSSRVGRSNTNRVPAYKTDRRPYIIMYEALKTYKKFYGNFRGLYKSFDFVVPSNNDWPSETWGLNLSQRIKRISAGLTYKKHHNELKLLGIRVGDDKKSTSSQ